MPQSLAMKYAVVYATDENYVKLTAVSIYSLLLNNPKLKTAVFMPNIFDAIRIVRYSFTGISFANRAAVFCGIGLSI